MSKFNITLSKGFQLTFANGNTISVQWGPGNYCEKYNQKWDAPKNQETWESKDAEIAIWNEQGVWITREIAQRLGQDINDDVNGYRGSIGRLSTDQVLAFIIETAK